MTKLFTFAFKPSNSVVMYTKCGHQYFLTFQDITCTLRQSYNYFPMSNRMVVSSNPSEKKLHNGCVCPPAQRYRCLNRFYALRASALRPPQRVRITSSIYFPLVKDLPGTPT